MSRVRLLLSAAFIACATSADAAAPAKPTESKQPEKQEFGVHERPWAKDYLAGQECAAEPETLEERAPGLIESKNKVELRLMNPDAAAPAPLNAALADTTAALDAISEERKRLEAEWKELEDARAVTELASRRAREEISALSRLRDDVAGLINELEIREDANIERVSDLVKNLSSKDAARLLATRDPKFIVEVLDVLDARLAADVLGRMETGRAEDVMALIATRGRPEAGDHF